MEKTNKILTIVTNIDEFTDIGAKTGLWFSELTQFWKVVEKAGYEIDIVSPLGGKIPLDPQSLMIVQIAGAVGLRGHVTKQYEDRTFMERLNKTLKVEEVQVEDYDAIYLVGGHGVMYDFTNHKPLLTLTAEFYEKGKIVSSVCHGPSGLLNVTLNNGSYLVDGKKVTGFSWMEEKLAKRQHVVPYNLEAELKKRGANYRKALLPFNAHIVVDGRLVTGQNPLSAKGVGKAVVKLLDHSVGNDN